MEKFVVTVEHGEVETEYTWDNCDKTVAIECADSELMENGGWRIDEERTFETMSEAKALYDKIKKEIPKAEWVASDGGVVMRGFLKLSKVELSVWADDNYDYLEDSHIG